jgi:hypothetical protein
VAFIVGAKWISNIQEGANNIPTIGFGLAFLGREVMALAIMAIIATV